EALGFAREAKLPFFILGGGSNLLVSDDGFSGVVIKNEIRGISFAESPQGVRVTAGAGEDWDTFVAEMLRRGLYGLENLSGIPGTVGAAPVQNIGAYGAEARDSIVSVEALDAKTGISKTFSTSDCSFGYRDSFFKKSFGKEYLVVGVTFHLKKEGALNIEYKDLKNYFAKRGEKPTLKSVRDAVLEIRGAKFPDLKTTGTAGSFFKNPVISTEHYEKLKMKWPNLPGFPMPDVNGHLSKVKVSVAWILDNILQYKGLKVGEVGLHHAQPLVLINYGAARASDVSSVAASVSEKVKEATGITLEWEVEKL
ncbi:MAG: UDP-N-acetylmuramate dehydrogenase, partial [Patescibacteria group bacterium]